MSKVKIRLMSTSRSDVEKLRRHFLKSHPQAILGKARMGSNPKYDDNQKWFVYGDYEFGKVRRRRGQ
jgi:hypothetical protein